MKNNEAIGQRSLKAKGFIGSYKWLILRRLTQLLTMMLFLLGPVAGIWIIKGNLASSLILDTVPLAEPLYVLQAFAAGILPHSTALIGVLIIITFYGLLGGRVYCSWFCPVNVVTDSADWLREKLSLTGSISVSRNTRYWILAIVVILPAITGTMAYESLNPVPMLHRAIIFGSFSALSVILAIFVFDLFIQKKGWCGHLCPMGALYKLIGSFSLVGVKADKRSDCDDCMDCFIVCPEPQVIKPALKGEQKNIEPVIKDSSCTNCGRCIDICHKDVFHFGIRK
ncbi:MAG: quinol dehydrogenase ferredoxin subunit NapH [Gammaproteobacteria bacterium]|nr:quinol dehydrogenase ferredoxin subunit NapH [Gammaproteobacteria bacterium]